ncbi:MAG: LacI family DNA-binding transcriptional regulator [Propionicimonas sp.]|uniref:LacI family DNA-binding transcriptional regulator n=1 Tax=Propionicimonas sp. TaxID=1955623 RepID=UPI003D0ED376
MTTEEERTKAATIFDVARLAGVSHQTVSRVLNDLPNVRPATRERVERAIKQLRYIPSPAARALVTRRSRTIGLITTGLPEFGPSTTAVHFNEAARDERYAVIMASLLQADAAALRQAAETLVRQNVEAIVLITSNRSTLGLLQGMDLGVPFLAVVSQGSGLHRVSLDQYAGARRAVRHLIELGHRDIRHLAGPVESMDALERIRGWRDALGEHDLVAHEPVFGDWTAASGYAGGQRLLGEDFTAVFCANDQMALGLIHALTEAGRPVPGRVSVVGFDDIPEAAHFTPPLTTMHQDFAQLGRDAMEVMLAVLTDEEAPNPLLRVPQLVLRASTAQPPS